ncbi:ABC transporter ATP-binding protein [Alkaliphilus transvaalensis]|uniref:ABC transporter ATP-binding protein n=1 Tax=Alkaliphilus transvaalensis TaxID=114628 RepID=UPI00047B4E48|nr:ABC transporter ATP-binding protein [Alkaliphilus transvaalensis]
MQKDFSRIHSFKWLYFYIKPHRFWLRVNIINALINVFVSLSIVYLLSQATDNGLANKYDLFIKNVYSLLALTGVGALLTYIIKYSTFKTSTLAIRDIRNRVVNNLQNTSISFMESINTGDVVTTLNDDINIVDRMLNRSADFITQPIILLSAIVYLYTINWKLLVAIALSMPIAMLINQKVGKGLAGITKSQQDHTAEANSCFYDAINIGGVYTSKTYNLEGWLAKRHKSALLKALKEKLKLNKFYNIYLLYIELGQVVVPIFICSLYGGYLAVNGEITVGQLIACQTLVVYLYNPSRQLLMLNNGLRSTTGAIARIGRLLDAPKDVFGTNDLPKNNVSIEFNKVSFSYDNQKNILNDITFKIEEGNNIALVGESGSGKSTVFKLLCGFYKNQLGEIKLYGEDIKKLDIIKVRENISIVSQDVYVFPTSIYENIKNGSKHATQEEVIAAAKLANIHDYIITLPNGYDTMIGENGVNLSGGQKQRLSIARAILKDAPILLLDEATSALDADSQQKINYNIKEIFKGKTTITIAHRLSSIIDADEILVLDNGGIVERGTHQSLLEKGHYFSELYHKQIK